MIAKSITGLNLFRFLMPGSVEMPLAFKSWMKGALGEGVLKLRAVPATVRRVVGERGSRG
jgi:hypothetical protein